MNNFTDLDGYLFGKGTHYDIYKKLGAHKGKVGKKQVLLQRFKNVYQGERDPLGRLIKEFEEYAESRSK